MDWISVDDEPISKRDGPLLVSDGHRVSIAKFICNPMNPDRPLMMANIATQSVTHWMWLPEPPQGKQERT